MPFVPHSEEETQQMLDYLKIDNINDLFDEIPAELLDANPKIHPLLEKSLNESETTRLMQDRAPSIDPNKSFIGAGAYHHFIPAAVWSLTSRGEFLTAYTPYQAEASQGSLQLTYEYQSLMANLMSLDVCNASLYDGATSLAEAILMCLRIKKNKANKVLVPDSLHPNYRAALKSLLPSDTKIINIPFDIKTGTTDLDFLKNINNNNTDIAALVINQPNFFGKLEPVDELTNWTKDNNILSIGVVNPTTCALFKPPGVWGDDECGVDIACGEGQPLGVPLSFGGPYFGFILSKAKYTREIPGRLVGKTTDQNNKTGFTLTLQSREQHIRRAKAKSNICTNQGLCVTAATIYMSLLGPEGLKSVALKSCEQAHKLYSKLLEIDGINDLFASYPQNSLCEERSQNSLSEERPLNSLCEERSDVAISHPNAYEYTIKLPPNLAQQLEAKGFQPGLCLDKFYPDLKNTYLLCATETKTDQDIESFCQQIKNILKANTSSMPKQQEEANVII